MALVDEYDAVICVAGSRSYNDYAEFSYWMKCYVETLGDFSFCFVSGDASEGADAMIIRWCNTHCYYCEKMPADWDEHGKSAGMIRNAEMRKVINRLVAFWDGVSRGTEEMIEQSWGPDIKVDIIIVTPDEVKASPTKTYSRKKHYDKTRGSRKTFGGHRSFRTWK